MLCGERKKEKEKKRCLRSSQWAKAAAQRQFCFFSFSKGIDVNSFVRGQLRVLQPQTAALIYSSASGRLAVSQSPSGTERSAPLSPHLTAPTIDGVCVWGVVEGEAERGKERVGSGPASHPPCEDLSLVTRAFKASSRVYPQPHVSLQFD